MKPTSTPPVSVVLTTYNRHRALEKTLATIKAQTFEDYELIICDDCSPDETSRVCEEYAAADPRVRYRRNATNLRMPGNLNAGIAVARGEFIANLHDGDFYRADLLEKWVARLRANPNAAFVFNQYLADMKGGGTQVHSVAMDSGCMDGREFLRRIFVTQWGSPVYGTVMARKACYDSVGPFDAQHSFNSDVEMWVRLAMRWDVAYVAEPLIHITLREEDHLMSRQDLWERSFDVRMKRRVLRQLHTRRRDPILFELRARKHYARWALSFLKNAEWSMVAQASWMALTGRDEIPAPY